MNQTRSLKKTKNSVLFEIAWEVCNPIGGIHTVLRSKAKKMIDYWGNNYFLVGPYIKDQAGIAFEETNEDSDWKSPAGRTVLKMKEYGIDAYFGRWLVPGKPRVLLFDPQSVKNMLPKIKYFLWKTHYISSDNTEEIVDDALCFGYAIRTFFMTLMDEKKKQQKVIAHFHEWLGATAIPDLRKEKLPLAIVFTTHATLLARYLASNDPRFHENLNNYDWEYEAKRLQIETATKLERAAAHGAHIFSTVSHVTAQECTSLLGRKPDVILPNGINVEKFAALHEFQNLHKKYKKAINIFVAGHFFQNHSFDLDKTLYFFTSGRNEFRNKGFDLTLEGLRLLNQKIKDEGIDVNVVMFIITQKANKGVLADVLQKRALMDTIHRSCNDIQKQIGEKLFNAITTSKEQKLPDLNQFVTEDLQLRLKKITQKWKTSDLPKITTHDLYEDGNDEVLNYLRHNNMLNYHYDRVKFVYHPDFVNPASPLLPLDYSQFVRGCHLGLFTSYYEPWGYTPLECIASGIPAVTSDLAGFGDFVLENNLKNIFVLKRKDRSFQEAAEDLAQYMLDFVKMNRRQRVTHRNKTENSSTCFDWSKLRKHYDLAHNLALARCFEEDKKK